MIILLLCWKRMIGLLVECAWMVVELRVYVCGDKCIGNICVGKVDDWCKRGTKFWITSKMRCNLSLSFFLFLHIHLLSFQWFNKIWLVMKVSTTLNNWWQSLCEWWSVWSNHVIGDECVYILLLMIRVLTKLDWWSLYIRLLQWGMWVGMTIFLKL